MKDRIETKLTQNKRRTSSFNSCHKIKENYLNFLEKREAFKFLSFFYEFSFLNPNHVFGFFLKKTMKYKL